MKYIISCILLLSLLSCQKSESNPSNQSSEVGEGGSLNTFTIIDDQLYTISKGGVQTFEIDDQGSIMKEDFTEIAHDIETLFPFGKYVLIGAESKMYIYETNATGIEYVSDYEHVRSCDPVIAQGEYAYVTLSSGNPRCPTGSNELLILNISDIFNPELVEEISMVNPLGLGIEGDLLFVCDQEGGFKSLDVKDKSNITFQDMDESITPKDVIATPELLMVTTEEDLVQYSYDQDGILHKLSSINL